MITSLTGCEGLGAGEGELEGDKWDATATVDATGDLEEGATYRRYWKQLGNKVKVQEITSTITIDTENSTLQSDTGYAVVGLFFDLNDTTVESLKEETDDYVDFVVFGFQPETGKYYLERWNGVKSQTKESLDTSTSDLGPDNKITNLDGKSSGAYVTPSDNDKTSMYNMEAGVITGATVKITQDGKGVYTVTVGTKEIGSFDDSENLKTRKETDKTAVEDEDDSTKTNLQGGIAAYINAPKGCKVVANYVQDKDSLKGSLFAEVQE